MERGRGGKGKGGGDYLPYFPQLASASYTTLCIHMLDLKYETQQTNTFRPTFHFDETVLLLVLYFFHNWHQVDTWLVLETRLVMETWLLFETPLVLEVLQ